MLVFTRNILVDVCLFRVRCFLLCYCSLVRYIVDMCCLIFIAFYVRFVSVLFCLFPVCSLPLCILVSITMLFLFVGFLFRRTCDFIVCSVIFCYVIGSPFWMSLGTISIGFCLGMALNSPCWDFVTRWIGGACPPARYGPLLPIGVRRVT